MSDELDLLIGNEPDDDDDDWTDNYDYPWNLDDESPTDLDEDDLWDW